LAQRRWRHYLRIQKSNSAVHAEGSVKTTPTFASIAENNSNRAEALHRRFDQLGGKNLWLETW